MDSRAFSSLVSVLVVTALSPVTLSGRGQTVTPDPDPQESPGERPYEMVWAKRAEPAPPTVRFDLLQGWRMEVTNGAEATLQVSRAQNVWNRLVARLRYRGAGKAETKPSIRLILPEPAPLPADADSVDLWVYGNRWDWENPPGTPPVRLGLTLRASDGQRQTLPVERVRWQEWWLAHKRLPRGLTAPCVLESIEIADGWQPEWREVYFDSIRFYREPLPRLTFAPRPKRNLQLPKGQSAGANTGPGRLLFPTRAETILPMQLGGKFQTKVVGSGDDYVFDYRGADCRIIYRFTPARGLGSVSAAADGQPVGVLLDGAGVQLAGGATNVSLVRAGLRKGVVSADYSDGTTLRFRLWQKSLVVDVANPGGQATELSFGQVRGCCYPRLIWVPYLTYGGKDPCVLVSRVGTNHVFTSLWLDWYRSNGSEPYGVEAASAKPSEPATARINGGVRYHPRTDERRNPMFERLFLTVSPVFEEVLPTIPHPVGLHAREAADRLWQESWGPDNYEKQMQRSRMLRAYGLEKLIQCNHEIAWRDGGESFTLRVRAAPKKGGDAALQSYVAHQRSLDWLAGLYSNYTDYAPVNEFWSPDNVQRVSDGNWRSAWPRCWALKPLRAVEFDALLAPQIKRKYQPTSAYTDVHTAVAPWGYNDYDARAPGAGTFAQTFYAYGELLRNDSRVYDAPIFSEGTYQWLYAGLADGNYALAYNNRPPAKEPLLPVFDLYQIHSRECDIGMGWTAHFCDAIPNWRAPENLDNAIDRFLLHTLAYGHIGWLVEEDFGITRTCRSYYMLQPVQARYALKKPTRIAYWDGARLVSVSEALVQDLPRTRRQLCVEYPGGLVLWLNDHPSENWDVPYADHQITLPRAGWAAYTKDFQLVSYSAWEGHLSTGETNRVDYLRCPAYTYLDGRGSQFEAAEASANGALVIKPLGKGRLEVIRISGEGAFLIRRPYGVRGKLLEGEAYSVEGKSLGRLAGEDSTTETRIEPLAQAIRYVLRFAQ